MPENLLIGGMLQFDVQDEANGVANIYGTDWLVGPCFVAKHPDQPLYFEGSILYGQTANEISPFGTYTDEFLTERWLATIGVSGEIEKETITLMPFVDARYTTDAQAAYIDSLGNTIAAQSISLGQLSAGLDLEMPIGPATMLNGGVTGVLSFSDSTGIATVTTSGGEGGRARVDLGLSHEFSDENDVALAGFYDGIGTPDFESYGLEVTWQVEF